MPTGFVTRRCPMTFLTLWQTWLKHTFGSTLRGRTRAAEARRRFRLTFESLEDRLVPATFTDSLPTLTLTLAANDAVGIVANANTYTLSLTSGAWNGVDDAFVTGNGTATLTAQKVVFTQVNITD